MTRLAPTPANRAEALHAAHSALLIQAAGWVRLADDLAAMGCQGEARRWIECAEHARAQAALVAAEAWGVEREEQPNPFEREAA